MITQMHNNISNNYSDILSQIYENHEPNTYEEVKNNSV